jgi:type I restriction enzyme S subunit
MDEWPVLSLREAGVLLIDCEHRTPPASNNGYPYIAIPQIKQGRIDLTDVRRITREHFIEWTRKANPETYDVILSRRCNPGATAYVPPGLECALGQNLVLLRADSTKVFPPFLRWLVRSTEWWEQVGKFINVGAVFDSLKCADIPNFRLPIPPLSVQHTIAALLGALDDKIELNQRMNETLEAMARAIFQSWFVDFDPVRAKAEGREPTFMDVRTAALFPDTLEDSALGKTPKGWYVGPLGEILELKRGYDLPQQRRIFGSVPIYSSSGLTGYHAEAKVRGPGIVTGRYGTIGEIFFVNEDFWPLNTTLYVQKFKNNIPRFIYYLLHTLSFEAYLDKAAVPGINRNHVHQEMVLCPPVGLQCKFVELLEPFWQLQDINDQEAHTLTALRDTILPKLMSGEIRLKNAEKLVEGVA